MLVGYVRVSKADGSQVTDLQRDALLAAGVGRGHIYEDTTSGRRDDRPGLAACLKALRERDTLIVWKLDRLGRDLRHLVNTVHELTTRGIGLKVLTGQGAAIDTTTAAGKLVFGDLRRAGGVRARVDRRADPGRDGRGAGARSARGSALQDDAGEAPAGDGGDGQARDPRSARCAANWASPARPSIAMSIPRGRCDRTARSSWPRADCPKE